MFTGKSSALVQIHNKYITIDSKITQLQSAYDIHNQFTNGLNATYAKLSGKWKVPKWIRATVSGLIGTIKFSKLFEKDILFFFNIHKNLSLSYSLHLCN